MTTCEKHNEERVLQGGKSRCKSCQREYQASWFEKNREAQRERVCNNTKKSRERNQAHVMEHLKSNPCIDCGESDPVVLEFDHREDKIDAICNMIKKCVSLKKLMAEIAKCDVRCANCHRRKTSSDFGYWRENF